jgi:hypothetical protein
MTHWAITHAALFGNKSSEWEETYIAWNDLFAAEGFTKDQLEAATIAVAKRFKVPVFASEHLNALREELRDIRKMDYERALRAARTMSPPCPDCQNQGMIHVPDPKHISACGEWDALTDPFEATTITAICDGCQVARLMGYQGQLISQYTTQVPNWRNLLARYLPIAGIRAKKLAATRESVLGEIRALYGRAAKIY